MIFLSVLTISLLVPAAGNHILTDEDLQEFRSQFPNQNQKPKVSAIDYWFAASVLLPTLSLRVTVTLDSHTGLANPVVTSTVVAVSLLCWVGIHKLAPLKKDQWEFKKKSSVGVEQ